MLSMSTRVRYAARIMVHLAVNDSGSPIRKQDIAEAEGISADYVEQILMKLKTSGLVVSRRGKHGGFRLGREPQEVTVADVVEAAEGPIALVPCTADETCRRASVCVSRRVWQTATIALNEVLRGTTIADLASGAKELRTTGSMTFEI